MVSESGSKNETRSRTFFPVVDVLLAGRIDVGNGLLSLLVDALDGVENDDRGNVSFRRELSENSCPWRAAP